MDSIHTPITNLEYLHSDKTLFKCGGKSFVLFSILVENTIQSINNFQIIKEQLLIVENNLKDLFNKVNGVQQIGIKTVIITNISKTNENRIIFKNLKFSDPYIFYALKLENTLNGNEPIIIRINCNKCKSVNKELTSKIFKLLTYNTSQLSKVNKQLAPGILLDFSPEILLKTRHFSNIRNPISSPFGLFKSCIKS